MCHTHSQQVYKKKKNIIAYNQNLTIFSRSLEFQNEEGKLQRGNKTKNNKVSWLRDSDNTSGVAYSDVNGDNQNGDVNGNDYNNN